MYTRPIDLDFETARAKRSAKNRLTNNSRFQVHEHSPGHMLARAGLTEERVEGVVSSAQGLVRGHLAVRLDAMLQAVQLPAGVADLHASLANVNGDAFPLWKMGKRYKSLFRKNQHSSGPNPV